MTPRWTGFRSVLCPIDFSRHAQLALRYAEAVALRGDATLTVTHVNDPLLVSAAEIKLRNREIAAVSAKELETFVAMTLGTRSKTHLNVLCQTSIGDPSGEIMAAVTRRRSDLIVMGTHGLTGPDRLLLGSTTLNVLQHCMVPVLAIPPLRGTSSGFQRWPGGQIVAPLELTAGADREAMIAARIAAWFGSSLLLLHVVDAVAAPVWLKRHRGPHTRIRAALARQQLDALADVARRHVETDTRIVYGHPADEIAAATAADRSGLLVTALRDRRGWFGARRGSVSYHVLTHAVAPVLAYPPQWRPR